MMLSPGGWISAGILVLAFALRVAWLDLKPAHFDEGVNGWFVDQITRQGYYHYDPSNFHGPLHFYVLFVSQTLFGRSLWALRLPLVIVSTCCVGVVLAYRRFFDERACQLAALAMAISPGMVFYGRYAIHESWLLLFLLITAWGILGWWQSGARRDLWAAALGATGMILIKETWIIHAVALLLAAPCLLLFEKLSLSAPWPRARSDFSPRDLSATTGVEPGRLCYGSSCASRRDLWILAGVCGALVVFFYSGAFLDWSSLPGLWEAFAVWTQTGVAGKTGHEKEWWYWLQLIGRYEVPAMLGLGGTLALLWPKANRAARFLAIYGIGALIGYSLVPYKTPWCVISLIWPFFFLFGLGVMRAAQTVDAPVTGIFTAIIAVFSLGTTLKLNFRDFTDEREPYVYVQTLPDMNALLKPLLRLTRLDPQNYFLTGHFIGTEQYPFSWILGDYPQVDFLSSEEAPAEPDAAFLVVDQSMVEKIEPSLRNTYLRVPVRLRGLSNDSAVLYLEPAIFGPFLPPETARFTPASAESKAEKVPPKKAGEDAQ